MHGYDLFLYDADGRRIGSINRFATGYPTRERAEESRKGFLRTFKSALPDVRVEIVSDADAEAARKYHDGEART
jgi:hypothetical protein